MGICMKEFIRVMKALGDPNRVKIIKMLGKKNLCVCEITAVLGLAQSTVSKHLRILEDAGLVANEKDGPWINYRLPDETESPYSRAMLDHLQDWLEDNRHVQEALLKAKTVDRGRICAA